MEHMDPHECYGCSCRIGFLRSALGPIEATFESAFDGPVHAAFCSVACMDDAIANAAAVRRTFPPPAGPRCDGSNLGFTER